MFVVVLGEVCGGLWWFGVVCGNSMVPLFSNVRLISQSLKGKSLQNVQSDHEIDVPSNHAKMSV